jgi:hypothetical protein
MNFDEHVCGPDALSEEAFREAHEYLTVGTDEPNYIFRDRAETKPCEQNLELLLNRNPNHLRQLLTDTGGDFRHYITRFTVLLLENTIAERQGPGSNN